MPVSSLALCFDAPMQSWGLRSRGAIRDAGREPSKSGVVGLLGAALGVARDDDEQIGELTRLRMGVRVDREGILERDYHTVQNVPTTSGTGHRTAVSERYYLADALFLVVLEGDRLDRIAAALDDPVWPLFFGRRAFPPARPLILGRPSEQPLETVLASRPWLEERNDIRAAERRRKERSPLRTVVDCDATDPAAETRPDVPVSFARSDRRFAVRTVCTGHVLLTDDLMTPEAPACS